MTTALDAVRQTVPATVALHSCAAADATWRVWGRNGTAPVHWCVALPWRTAEWRVLLADATCPCVVPRRLSMTGVQDMRRAPGPVGDNVRRTVATLGFDDVAFYTDADCLRLLRDLETTDDFRNVPLARSFLALQDGRIRSDVCRLAMLWREGGYYMDNDLVPLADVTRYLLPQTQFATVTTVRMFGNAPGMFNAFLAASPRHPVVDRALRLHAAWTTATATERRRFTRGVALPNIGTVLLRDAVRTVVGDDATFACERTGQCAPDVQLFREVLLDRDSEYNATGLCVMCDATHACNFAVADVASGDIVFKSRVAARGTSPCPLRCPDSKCVPHPPPAFGRVAKHWYAERTIRQ